jgi:pimeloyl-ACP methyl ester carboxylesterase
MNSVDPSTQAAAPNNQPSNPPFIRSGHLAAAGFSEHRIYWEEYGSLAGEPVIVMHGGPGAGSHSSSTRFFDPQRYRVVLFDQRGSGKSTPSRPRKKFVRRAICRLPTPYSLLSCSR